MATFWKAPILVTWLTVSIALLARCQSVTTISPSSTSMSLADNSSESTPTVYPAGTATVLDDSSDLGLCPCDLTWKLCDINCCCDNECTNADRLVFSQCDDADLPTQDNSYLCTYDQVHYLDFKSLETSTYNPNVFCVWADRNTARNYYSIPSLAKTTDEYDSYQVDESSYGYSSAPVTTSLQYKSGDPISVQSKNQPLIKGILTIPTSAGMSTQCLDTSPVRYLINQDDKCYRYLQNELKLACETDPSLNAERLLSRLNDTYIEVVDGMTTTQIDIEVLGDIQTPIYNPTKRICIGALTQVHYDIAYWSSQIVSVKATLVLEDIPGDYLQIKQAYSVQFTPHINGTTESYSRSGNPGYLIGYPVIAGQLSGSYIEVNGNNNQYLSLVSATADGNCLTDSTSRASIRFGENMRSGCLLNVPSLSNSDPNLCSKLLNIAKEALLGPSRTVDIEESIYIASYGNSDRLQVADWVPLLVTSLPPSSSCVGLSMHMEILYSYTGALNNPQAMIVGAKLVFDTIDYEFLCLGVYCANQRSQDQRVNQFEVVSSVNFVDVTQAAQVAYAEVPVTSSKLPADFFRPYYHGDSSSRSPCFTIIIAGLLLLALLTM